MVFDWTDRRQLRAYFDLHKRFERQGTAFWWLDWCCDGSSASAPGLSADTWINRQYALRQRARGSRWPAFQRIGGSFQEGFGGSGGTGAFAEHAYTIQFTGDTCGSWPLLGFAAEFTAAAASIGMPYVSHDIGTFHAVSPTGVCDKELSPILTPRFNSLPPEMYVRWVQLGAFQPFDRLHSHHGQRLPWEYPSEPGSIAAEFLRLRGTLVPYLYTLAREAYDRGLPLSRPLYLQWPRSEAAYNHGSQYTLGSDLLVAAVSEPGDPASVEVWFPPGRWIDWFTGRSFSGPRTTELDVPLARFPVFGRAGTVIPTQPPRPTTRRGPARELVLVAFRGSGAGSFYDDSGSGFAYERGAFTRTALRQRTRRGATILDVGRARGSFSGAPASRSYELRLIGTARPDRVRVAGETVRGWSYAAATRTLNVDLGRHGTDRGFRVVVR